MIYLFLDTETGGLGLDKSLLTLYIEATNSELETLGNLMFVLKPDDGIYHVEASGLAVNKIDLVKHEHRASTYSKAAPYLYEFLKKWSPGPKECVVVGHGVDGDIRQIHDKLLKKGTWETFCSHRTLDTSSICKYLQLRGILDPTLTGSLESLKNFLGINEQSHTADGDVRVCKAVLKYFLSLKL